MINSQLRPNSVDEPRLLVALDSVAREDFVPAARRATAYADAMIPLGDGRFMNSPLVTARLIASLDLQGTERVLVAGDATGYAAAVVAHLAREVVRVEDAKGGDYDALLIDGAVAQVPPALVRKLRDGTRVAAGFLDGRVTRLAQGVKRGDAVRLVDFGDAEIAILSETVPAPVFSF
jgi:protein-L-isoaspartate(D-aspartate) O-methyltransferase